MVVRHSNIPPDEGGQGLALIERVSSTRSVSYCKSKARIPWKESHYN